MPSDICNLRAGRLCAARAGLRCRPRGRRDRSRVLAARTRRGREHPTGRARPRPGCGHGPFRVSSPCLESRGGPRLLSRDARDRARKAPLACVRADGHRLPLRADAIDVTVIVMVLQHLHYYELVLREVARVSHRVVIATTDLFTRTTGIIEEAFPSLMEIDRIRFPRTEALVVALERSGFGNIRTEERAYVRKLTVTQQLDRVRRKYLSTFDLLPPGEFDEGVRFLARELPRRFCDRFELMSSFTFLGGTR